jgi:DNA-binding transcriptional LysR family regulator
VDTLTGIRVFRQIVESGSFAAAAGRLDLSTAMVSKHVMSLEKRLGVRLLNRNSRTLSLTEPGRVYFERCKTILDDLEATELELGSLTDTPRGTLRITCPSFTTGQRLADVLAEYRRHYPEVIPDVSFEDRVVDIVEEGYDLALRVTRNASSLPSGLIARRIRQVDFVLAASQEYLREHGTPKSLDELSQHDFVAARDFDSLPLMGPEGIVHVPVKVVLRYRAGPAASSAVAAGIGIGALPALLFDDPTFRGRLVPILPQYPLQKASLYAVYVSRKYVPLKIRSFIEFLTERVGDYHDPRLRPIQAAALAK